VRLTPTPPIAIAHLLFKVTIALVDTAEDRLGLLDGLSIEVFEVKITEVLEVVIIEDCKDEFSSDEDVAQPAKSKLIITSNILFDIL
jgi:hypothetical protein